MKINNNKNVKSDNEFIINTIAKAIKYMDMIAVKRQVKTQRYIIITFIALSVLLLMIVLAGVILC